MHIFLKKDIDNRKIRNLTTALLKSKEVKEIKRFNYIASYTLVDWKIQKEQEKSLYFLGVKNLEKVVVMMEKVIGKNYQIMD